MDAVLASDTNIVIQFPLSSRKPSDTKLVYQALEHTLLCISMTFADDLRCMLTDCTNRVNHLQAKLREMNLRIFFFFQIYDLAAICLINIESEAL